MILWHRFRQAGLVLLAGGMLLQTNVGCEDLLAPVVANVISSVLVNALLGGLTV